MRHALIRSVLDRDVCLQSGERFIVRSPTVGEALTVLACYEGALRGESVQTEVLFEALAHWLPSDLYKVFTRKGYPVQTAIGHVLEIVNEGVPQLAIKKAEAEGKPVTPGKIAVLDWDSVVADYMAAYGATLSQTLAEPWNGFLLLSERVDMIQARETLRIIRATGLPYIKDDRERQKAMDELVVRAGGRVETDEERRERLLSIQQQQLDILARQFAQAGAFVGPQPPKPRAEA